MIPALIRLHSLQLIEKEMKNDFILPRVKLVLRSGPIVIIGTVASQERSLISKQRERGCVMTFVYRTTVINEQIMRSTKLQDQRDRARM